MKVEIHDGLGNPVILPASRVLITTDDGTPIAFCLEAQKGHFRHFRAQTSQQLLIRAGDPDFQDQLMAHGILKTVVVKTLDTSKPKG